MSHHLRFRRHGWHLAVCRLPAGTPAPSWASDARFSSVTATPSELSIVCPEDRVPEGVPGQGGWACLELIGPFSFSLTGVLASCLEPLALAGIPIFAVSTFDTDWILVPAERLDDAVRALAAAGHNEI